MIDSKDDREPPNEYYLVVPDMTNSTLLLVLDNECWQLPVVTLDKGTRNIPVGICRGLLTTFNVSATILRCLSEDYDPLTHFVSAVYLMEVHSLNSLLPSAAKWIAFEDLDGLQLGKTEHNSIVNHLINRVDSMSEPPAIRVPWAERGWLAEVIDWIQARLTDLSISVIEPIEQIKSWDRSCVVRIPTNAGRFYFKALPSMYAQEIVILEYLSRQTQFHTPQILECDNKRLWLLMNDIGGNPLYQYHELPVWESALCAFANLQIECITDSEYLLTAGCQDRRPTRMAIAVEELWEEVRQVNMEYPAIGLSDAEIAKLRAIVPELKALCQQLENYPLPNTLEHGDLHAMNIAITKYGPAFFDWSDSAIAHPFFSIFPFISDAQNRLPRLQNVYAQLRDRYLSIWLQTNINESHIFEAFELTRTLAPLYYLMAHPLFFIRNIEMKNAWFWLLAKYVRSLLGHF